MSPSAIRRVLIAAAVAILGVGLFIAIAVMAPAACYGMDSMCWFNRWRVLVGSGSAFIAITLLLLSIPDHGRTADPDE